MQSKIFIPLVLLTLLCACTGKVDTPVPEPEPEWTRHQKDFKMHSGILGTDVMYSVYLPEDYETDTLSRYSVVYMLHGLGDNWNSWNGNYIKANTRVNVLESRGTIGKMIYVFPAGFSTYFCNYYNGKYDYMDMFAQEFIPHIDSLYRTVPDRNHRATVGYSMGGFGAFALASQHPELFCACVPLSMSVRTDGQYLAESQSGWDQQWGKIFGGIGKSGDERITDYYRQHCPFYLYNDSHRETLEQISVMMVCGDDEDQILIAVDTLHTQMLAEGFDHEFRVTDGGHSATVWNNALMEALPYLDHIMNGSSAWPDCSRPGFSKADVSFLPDGTALAPGYDSAAGCAAFYIFHNGLELQTVKDVTSVIHTSSSKKNFVYLPCDLTQKTVEEWVEFHDLTYNVAYRFAVGIADAAAAVLDSGAGFGSCAFIDGRLGEKPEAKTGVKYYFSTADDSPAHISTGAFYRSCKRNGVEFEYRVINGTGADDILNCTEILKTYITY